MAATRITSQDIKDATLVTGDIGDDQITDAVINDTAVTPGSYTYASITVGQTGRVTAASSGTAPLTVASLTLEVPSGTVDGANATFTISRSPTVLLLHKNGILQKVGAGNDFTVSTTTITFLAGNLPQTGDNLLAVLLG